MALFLAPAAAALAYVIEPVHADIIGCSTGTTVIPGFTVESIAAGLLVGLLLIIMISHRGFELIRTRIGVPRL
jgi:hypothetical protein